MNKKLRKVIYSVNNFLYCGDEYLMLHRSLDKSVDGGRLNGIGGKLEKCENFLSAAIRETEEETGFVVDKKDISFCGIITLHNGYPDDWVMCFYKIRVPDKKIPHGNKTPDGNLLWMHKDSILTSGYELVDDLNYCWKNIINDTSIFFATTEVGADEKVKHISLSTLGTT